MVVLESRVADNYICLEAEDILRRHKICFKRMDAMIETPGIEQDYIKVKDILDDGLRLRGYSARPMPPPELGKPVRYLLLAKIE